VVLPGTTVLYAVPRTVGVTDASHYDELFAQVPEMSDGATKQPASPSTEPVDLSVVIPVYNKEGVIADTLQQVCGYVSQSDLSIEVIVVDDASPDASGEIVQAFIDKDDSSRFTLLTNETNRRKGGAVQRGVMAAKGRAIAFIDADYAYPVEQLDHFVAEISAGADVVLGNRIDPESRYLVRPTSLHYIYHRYLIGRTFNLLVRSLLVRGIADTQCGIKCFRAEAAREIFGSMTVTNFAFDVEVVLGWEHSLSLPDADLESADPASCGGRVCFVLVCHFGHLRVPTSCASDFSSALAW